MLTDMLGMMGNYEERKVALYNEYGLCVSTAKVTDGDHPFETAIQHPQYDRGNHITVEAYDSREDAQSAHTKWVTVMTSDNLPESLTDCQNSEISQWLEPEDLVFKRKEL